jgi:Primase C terminal 1 (PriCT-1)
MIEGTGKRLSVFPIPISTMTLVSQRQLQRPLAPVVTLHSETTTVGEGSRNASLTSLAGTLRRKGLGFEEIYGTLLEVNQKRCDPPLDQREVEGIANYSSTEKFLSMTMATPNASWHFMESTFVTHPTLVTGFCGLGRTGKPPTSTE